MPLSFLVPAFLAGLAAIAIPIWVHLRNRPHDDAVDFPSLMFLQRAPRRSVQRQTIRHRALLAVRVAALGIMVLAFARPFFTGAGASLVAGGGAREVVILLDRSWSMSYGDRWAQATAAVSDRLAGLSGADRASLVVFDSEAEVIVAGSDGGRSAAAALGALEPGSGTTDLASGLRAAADILERSALPNREVVLVSDFQRRGWDPNAELALPDDVALETVSIGEDETVNAAVAEVVARRAADDGDRVTITARLTRAGGREPTTVPVTLEVDGQPLQQVEVELPGTGAAQVVFDPVVAPDRLDATVRLPRDRLAGDDVFYATTGRGRPVRVLVFENPAANNTDSLFLRRALAIGNAPAFAVQVDVLGDLTDSQLADTAVVVLNDVGQLDTAAAAALRRYVESGGGLLVALGEQTERLEPGVTEKILPFAPAAIADRSTDLGASLAFIDADHPALEIFGGGGDADLSMARTYRYRQLQPEPEAGVMARYDDGQPALVEHTVGAGRVVVLTTTLDTFWTDLPQQSFFLPLVHELVKYAAGYREPPAWLPAGATTSVGALSAAAGAVAAEPAEVLLDGARLAGAARLSPGIHAVTWTGSDGGAGSGSVAVNLDRAESDLATVDAEEVAASVRRLTAEAAGAEGVESEHLTNRAERGQSLWWYLLILAFVVLAAETALSNSLSPRAS